jgi:hypothetical protein
MRKVSLVVLLVLLILSLNAPAMVGAQVEALAACTEEEAAASQEILADTLAATEEIAEGDFDPTATDFAETALEIEALSRDYWTNVYPELPTCAEAQSVGFGLGLFIDAFMVASLELNVAGWAAAAEDAAGAEYLTGEATTRIEEAQEMLSDMEEVGGIAGLISQLEVCTEDDLAAAEAVITGSGEAFAGMMEELAGLEEAEDPVFATVSSYTAANEFAKGFWDETTDSIPLCQEAAYATLIFGLALNEATIITALRMNAALEEANGNPENAEALAAAADVRAENLQAMTAE